MGHPGARDLVRVGAEKILRFGIKCVLITHGYIL